MALNISFKEKSGSDIYYNRFKSALELFNTIKPLFEVSESKLILYKDSPLPEFNDETMEKEIDIGILEYIKKVLSKKSDLENERLGMQIKSHIKFKIKSFDLIADLMPPNNNRFYDFYLEIIPNVYSKYLEDLVIYNKEFFAEVANKIKKYNSKVKERGIFEVKRAVFTELGNEVHKMHKWKFLYTEKPEEFITTLSFVYKNIENLFFYSNRQRAASLLFSSMIFTEKLGEIAENTRTNIIPGSITIIPKDSQNMENFLKEVAGLVESGLKEIYKSKEDLPKELDKGLSKYKINAQS